MKKEEIVFVGFGIAALLAFVVVYSVAIPVFFGGDQKEPEEIQEIQEIQEGKRLSVEFSEKFHTQGREVITIIIKDNDTGVEYLVVAQNDTLALTTMCKKDEKRGEDQ